MSGERKGAENKGAEDKGAAYTYILRCSDGSLYTGWTYDLEKRLQAHNSGKGAKYTRSRTPVELVYYEAFERKEEAMSREVGIKSLTRQQKMKLILDNRFLLSEGGNSHEGNEPKRKD